jgi:hypothetical protein
MRVRFELGRDADGLRELLRSGGWKLEETTSGTFYASHPGAGDQPSARSRLHQLGLLTSPRLRIEFGPLQGARACGTPRQDVRGLAPPSPTIRTVVRAAD